MAMLVSSVFNSPVAGPAVRGDLLYNGKTVSNALMGDRQSGPSQLGLQMARKPANASSNADSHSLSGPASPEFPSFDSMLGGAAPRSPPKGYLFVPTQDRPSISGPVTPLRGRSLSGPVLSSSYTPATQMPSTPDASNSPHTFAIGDSPTGTKSILGTRPHSALRDRIAELEKQNQKLAAENKRLVEQQSSVQDTNRSLRAQLVAVQARSPSRLVSGSPSLPSSPSRPPGREVDGVVEERPGLCPNGRLLSHAALSHLCTNDACQPPPGARMGSTSPPCSDMIIPAPDESFDGWGGDPHVIPTDLKAETSVNDLQTRYTTQLNRRDSIIAQRDAAIKERNDIIGQRDATIAEQGATITLHETTIKELRGLLEAHAADIRRLEGDVSAGDLTIEAYTMSIRHLVQQSKMLRDEVTEAWSRAQDAESCHRSGIVKLRMAHRADITALEYRIADSARLMEVAVKSVVARNGNDNGGLHGMSNTAPIPPSLLSFRPSSGPMVPVGDVGIELMVKTRPPTNPRPNNLSGTSIPSSSR